MTRISIAESDPIGARVAAALFGANLLFNRDLPASGTYGDVFDLAGATEVRFPGGSITEWMFDVTDPNKTAAWGDDGKFHRLLPLTTFMGWAGENNHTVSIVIPTRGVLEDGALGTREVSSEAVHDVGVFVRQLMNGKYGDANIGTFELGNEYWGSGEMTASEYGKVASALALEINRQITAYRVVHGLAADWEGPRIAVQMGENIITSSTPGSVQNQQIMDEFNSREAAAVDAVIGHFYVREHLDYATSDHWMFERMDTWRSDGRFGNLDYIVSEWNTSTYTETLTGLRGVSAVAAMFGEMVNRGVDVADIWPLQQTTINDLAGNEGDGSLTAVGQMFRLLAMNVRGAYLDYRQIDQDFMFHSFSKVDETVVFVSSRTADRQNFTQDIDEITSHFDRIRATVLRVDGNPLDPEAAPILSTFWLHANASGVVSFSLGPYETIMLEIMNGSDSQQIGKVAGNSTNNLLKGDNANNLILGLGGSDDLFGRSGNDTLDGGTGHDRMIGGTGNDTYIVSTVSDVILERAFSGNDTIITTVNFRLPRAIENLHADGNGALELTGNRMDNHIVGNTGANILKGWRGDDVIFGEEGQDRLFGNEGNDRLYGGSGNDSLCDALGNNVLGGGIGDDLMWSGNGRDILRGGGGDDTLIGGTNSDTLVGGSGNDVIIGGSGNDKFVFDSHSGSDVIRDFQIGHDHIYLSDSLQDAVDDGHYELWSHNGITRLSVGNVTIFLQNVVVHDIDAIF
jgi:Ca2+-binding RTX toxin-like protein